MTQKWEEMGICENATPCINKSRMREYWRMEVWDRSKFLTHLEHNYAIPSAGE
jgi:hypothetical protein